MKHLIFNTEQEALALNSRVTNDAITLWTDGITNNYCIPKKHATLNKWAIIIDPMYEQYFTPAEILSSVELTEDWNPAPVI